MRSSVSALLAAFLTLSVGSAPRASAHPSSGIVVDEKGQVFFTDNGATKSLWKIDAAGNLTRFQRGGWHWLALDETGNYSEQDLKEWWQKRITMNFGRVSLPNSKRALLQADGAPFVVGRDGNLYWAKGNVEIARLSPDGKVTLLAAGLKETAEKLGGLRGLASGPDGGLYAACPSAVLKIDPEGKVTTLVHPIILQDVDAELPPGTPDDQKPFLRGLAVDSRGTVYAAATGCHCVVKITPDGQVGSILKAERPWSPTGVAVRGEDIYVLEYTNANRGPEDGWLPRVRKLGRDGTVTTLATISRQDQGSSPPQSADKTHPGPLHLVLQAPPPVSVNSVAVSPDGSLIATAADGVRLYDARTGTLLRAIGNAGDRGVAFSPDGRTLAAAGFHMDKLVGIYDVQTGKRLQSLAGHTEWETDALAFSPDGKLLASTGVDKQILVWELATGTLRHRLADQPFRVPVVTFSPDSATLASGGDKTIRLWDVATGRLRRTLTGHRDWVCTLAFAPEGQTIASGSCDWAYHRGRNTAYFPGRDPGYESQCKIWSTATGDVQRTISQPGRLLSLAFAPDGKSVACGFGMDVRLYELGTETPGRVVTSHDFAVTSVAFTPDGTAIISGSHDHTVKRTNLATGQTEWQAPGSFEQVNAVALSKDAALLVTGSSDGRYAHGVLRAGARVRGPGAVRLWEARTGCLLRRLGDPAEQIMAVALSPDGRRIASGGGGIGGSGIVRLWDTATGTPVWSADDHVAEVLAIAYAPDASSVATAAADGLVKLRDPATGAVRQILAGHAGGATSLAFSADGALLACGEGHGATRLWEARTGRLLRICKAAGSQAPAAAREPNHRLFTSLALSPDGGTLITNAGGGGSFFDEPVKFWDTHTGELRKEFADKQHGAHPVALSPDGSMLAAGGKTIKLWDMRTRKLLRELFGHLKITESITFSADGRFLVSGGSYGTTNVWEVATGRHLVTLFTFPGSQKGTVADDWLAYHPDGYYDGSPGVERYLAWRVGDDLQTPDTLGVQLHRPDRIEAALKLPLANRGLR
jgi:WD40 repeat protein